MNLHTIDVGQHEFARADMLGANAAWLLGL
jgi:hypothetical protein